MMNSFDLCLPNENRFVLFAIGSCSYFRNMEVLGCFTGVRQSSDGSLLESTMSKVRSLSIIRDSLGSIVSLPFPLNVLN